MVQHEHSASLTQPLSIQMLGRFRVAINDEPVDERAWGTHRAKPLLKLLLTSYSQPLHKDQIIEALWADSQPKNPIQALYTAVSDLRRALEPGLRRAAESRFILSSDSGYMFNTECAHSLDYQLFLTAVQQARQERSAANMASATQHYLLAEGLYQGEFLPDDRYAEWSYSLREQLQTTWTAMQMELAELHMQQQSYRQVVAVCNRLLTDDPCHEAACGLMMQAHTALGAPARALRAYKDCAGALERDLGIGPSAELQALAERLHTQPAAAPASAPQLDSAPAPAVAARPPQLSGRQPIYASLSQRIARQLTDHGQLILLLGEGGIGKTTLIEQLLLEHADLLWLRAQAHELTQDLPFQQITTLLLQAHQAELLTTLDTSLQQQLARMLPELLPANAAEFSDTRPLYDDKTRLFEAIRQTLIQLPQVAKRPIVLVVDDLQWADQGTLELLAYLGPHLTEQPITIMGLSRPSERIKPLLARADRDSWITALTLTPLDADDTAVLLGMLTASPGPLLRLGQRLHRATGGNPLLIKHVLSHLIDSGQLWRSPAGHWQGIEQIINAPILPTPTAISEIVDQQIAATSPTGRQLLNLLAVIGQPAPWSWIEASNTADSETLLDALDELIASEMLHITPANLITVQHDAVREAVYARITPPRRQRLHAQVASVIEQTHEQQHTGLLGIHWLRAQVWEKAVGYLLAAGDAALQIYAYPEARNTYAQALQALDHLHSHPSYNLWRIEALIKLDNASFLAGPVQQNLSRLREAENLVQLIDGPVGDQRRAHIYLALGRGLSIQGDQRAALGYLQRVLPLAQQLDSPELAAVPSAALGVVAFQQGRFQHAADLLGRSLASLERIREWNYWILAICHYAMALSMQGHTVAALAMAQHGLGCAVEAQHLTGITQMHAAICMIGWASDNLERAQQAGQAAIDAAVQSGDLMLAAIAHQFSAWCATRHAEHALAQQHLEQVEALSQQLGGLPFFGDWFAAAAAERTLAHGDLDAAAAAISSACTVAEQTDCALALGIAMRLRGQLITASDQARTDGRAATAAFAASVEQLSGGNAVLELARTYAAWGQSCREYGDTPSAQRHLEQAKKLFAAAGLERERTLVQAQLAVL